MKTQSLVLVSTRPQAQPDSRALLSSLENVIAESGRLMLAMLGAVTVLLLAGSAVSMPSLAPYGQAAAWAAGFVFLALATDAGEVRFALYLASGVAMIACALLAASAATGFLVPAGMIASAWVAAWLYRA